MCRKHESATFSSIEYFIHRYPHLESFIDLHVIDTIQQQFISYQLLEDTDIPPKVWEDATVKLDEDTSYIRVDVIWNYSFKIKVTGSTELKFSKLKDVIQSILVIPNSYAAEERAFSLIQKNKTPFRPSLGLEVTLSSIVGIKLVIPVRDMNQVNKWSKIQRRQLGNTTKPILHNNQHEQ